MTDKAQSCLALSRLKHGFESRRERHPKTLCLLVFSAYRALGSAVENLSQNGASRRNPPHIARESGGILFPGCSAPGIEEKT